MKGLKKNSVRTRKRVIAILLSVLMVLSIVIPSGGSGVRYNAYAEGEESALGEGVDLTSEEGTAEEELTSEETTEETMEETSDISSEETTETNDEDGDSVGKNNTDELNQDESDNENASTSNMDEEDLFEEGENLLGSNPSYGDEEFIEEESILGDEESSTSTPKLSFMNKTPDTVSDTSKTGQKSKIVFSLGTASNIPTDDYKVQIEIDSTDLDFTNFTYNDANKTSGKYTVQNSTGHTLNCSIEYDSANNKTVITISGMESGDTGAIELDCEFKDGTDIGKDTKISVNDNNIGLNDSVTVTHTPADSERPTVVNDKELTSSGDALGISEGKLTSDSEVSFSMNSVITLPASFKNSADVNKVKTIDSMSFGDDTYINSSDWESFKNTLSGTAVSGATIEPVTDGEKITGFTITKTYSETEKDALINNAVQNGSGNYVYTTDDLTLIISSSGIGYINVNTGVGSGVLTNNYKIQTTYDYAPDTWMDSSDNRANQTFGTASIVVDKSCSDIFGENGTYEHDVNNKANYYGTYGNIIEYSFSATNNGIEDYTDFILTDVLPSSLKLADMDNVRIYKNWMSGNDAVREVHGGGNWSYTTDASGNVVMTFEHLNQGETVSGKIYCEFTNNAAVDPIVNTLSNNKTTDEDTSKIREVEGTVDIDINKTANTSIAKNGDEVTFTITAENKGTASADSVKIKDILPSGLEFVSAECDGTSYNSLMTEWTVDIPAQKTKTVLITARVTADSFSSITNTAEAYYKDELKDSDTFTITEPNWDGIALSIDKKVTNKSDNTKGSNVEKAEANKDETVTYTIRVKNESGSGINLSSFPSGSEFFIEDVLPAEIDYAGNPTYSFNGVEKGAASDVSYNNTDRKLRWVYTGETGDTIWENGKEIVLSFDATVNTDVIGTYTNTATSVNTLSDTADVDVIKEVELSLKKYISEVYDENGVKVFDIDSVNDAVWLDSEKTIQVTSNEIKSGYVIRYSVIVKNESSTETLDNFVLKDTGTNVTLVPITDEANGIYYSEEITVKNTSGTVLGYIYCNINNIDSSKMYLRRYGAGENHTPTGLSIDPGKSVIFEYDMNASDNSQFTNYIEYDGSRNSTVITKPVPELVTSKEVALIDKDSITDDYEYFKNASVSFEDNVEISKASIETESDYVIYKLHVDVDSEDTYNGFTVTDTIPEYMDFVTSGVPVARGNARFTLPVQSVYVHGGWDNTNYWSVDQDTDNYKFNISNITENPDGSKSITISSDTFEFKNTGTDYIDIYLLATIDKDALPQDFEGVLTNNANISVPYTAIVDGEPAEPDTVSNVSASVNVMPGQINANFTKESTGTYNRGTTDKNGNGLIDLDEMSTASPSAGDNIIWKITLKNENLASSKNMENYTITDSLPYPYSYENNEGSGLLKYYPTIKIYHGNILYKTYGQNSEADFIEPTLVSEQTSTEGAVYKWTFNSTDYNGDFILSPGDRLEIEFPTKASVGVNDIFTNNATVSFGEDLTDENVVTGTLVDSENIGNSGIVNIGGYATTSVKTIKYTHNNNIGSPETDTGNGKTSKNYVQGLMGDNVLYTLSITNTSVAVLDSFVIIDRLPYVGDIGIIDGDERNSAFEVKYDSSKAFTVKWYDKSADTTTDITDKVTLSSAAELSTPVTIANESDDWRNLNGKYTWTSGYTDGNKLLRFAIDSSVKFDSADSIEIQFYGLVPEDVTAFGESNIAWNNFGYAYHAEGEDANARNSAQPPVVGVWVENPGGTVSFEASKLLNNGTPNEAFSFQIKELNVDDFSGITSEKLQNASIIGNTVATGASEANSSEVAFTPDSISYTREEGATSSDIVKHHFYIISEVSGSDTNMVYDTKQYIVRVDATTYQSGAFIVSSPTLVATYDSKTGEYHTVTEVDATAERIKFNNTKKAKLTIVKTYADGITSDTVKFGVYDSVITAAETNPSSHQKAIVTIDSFVNGIGTGEAILNIGTTYFVYELDENNQPIITTTGRINGKNYTVGATDNIGIEFSITDNEKSSSFTNTFIEDRGSITAKKKFVSVNGKEDIFYLSLFTVDGTTEALFGTGAIKSTDSMTGTSAGAEKTVTWTNVPYGKYKVYETDSEGNKLGSSIEYTINSTDGLEVELNSAIVDAGTITNTENVGGFTVQKIVTGDGKDSDKTFPIDVKLTFPSASETGGIYKIGNGVAQSISVVSGGAETTVHIDLSDTDIATFDNLPYGTTYEVTESIPEGNAYKGYTKGSITYGGSDSATSGTVGSASSSVVVNNIYTKTAKLTINKNVTGREWSDIVSKVTFNVKSTDNVFTKDIQGSEFSYDSDTKTATYVLDDLDISKTYNVTEVYNGNTTEDSYYSFSNTYGMNPNPDTRDSNVNSISFTSSDSDKTVYFINKYDRNKGQFTITKNVERIGETGTETGYNANREFDITVTFAFPAGFELTTVKVNDVDTVVNDSKVTIHLKEDATATFTDLPYGTTYQVEETISDDALQHGYSKADENIVYSGSATFGLINSASNNVNVTVNNKYKWPVDGFVKITKKVTGDRAWNEIKGTVKFSIYQYDNTISGYESTPIKEINGTDDGWQVEGDTYVFNYSGLDTDKKYKVVETIDDTTTLGSYFVVSQKAGTTSTTATENNNSVDELVFGTGESLISAFFENKYTVKKGSFTVKKIVDNSPNGDETEFPIVVTLTYPNNIVVGGKYIIGTGSENEVVGGTAGVTINDNVAAISLNLKHGESVTFTNIPYGTTYTVTEGALDGAAYNGYSWKSGTEHIVYGDKGKIVSDNAIDEVTVNNVYTPEGKIVIYKTVDLPTGVSWDDIKGSISFIISDNDNATDDIEISGSSLTWDNTLNAYIYTKGDIPLDKTYTVKESVNTASGTAWFKYDVTTKAGTTQAGLTDSSTKEVAVGAITATNPVGKAYYENRYTVKTGKLIIKKSFDPVPTGVANYEDEVFDVAVTLTDENNNPVTGTYGTTTFNSEGKATVHISVNAPVEITDIPYGYKYSYVEQGKTGYQNVSNGTVTNKVISAVSDTQTITNKYAPDKGRLKLVKRFADDSTYKADDVNAKNLIVFTVTGPDNYSKTVDYYDIKTAGEVVLSDLAPGDYTVTEISNVSTDTYIRTTKIKVEATGTDETADSKVVEVSAGAETTVIVTNDYQYNEKAELDISKLVNGANSGDKKFELEIVYTKDATTKYVAVDSASSTGYKLVDERPTGNAVPVIKSGEVLKIRNLPFGTYAVSEKTGSIDLDNYIFNAGTSTTSGSVTFTSNTTQTVTLKNNYSEDRSVKISKLVFGTDTALENAKLQLIEGDTVKEEWTTDGTFKTITGLKSGVNYKIREVSAPDGYTTVKDITFVIDENNKVTVTPGKVGEATATGDIINVYDKKTSVKISKVDITNEKELPGATIQILDKDGNVVTDENGDKLEWTSTSTPKEIVGLKTGVTYTLRETVAPDGYQLTTDTVFKLNKDGSLDGTATTTTVSNEGVLLVEDAPLGAFAVNKKGYYNELCSDGANATIPLEGVKFTLTKKDDATFGQTKETDKDGIAAFTGLQPGTYEFKETQTIEGYILDESVYTIKINADGSNDGLKDASGKAVEGNIITNDVPRTNLQLVKVNLSNKNVKLPGSTYGLFRKSLGIGTDTGKGTNEDGQLVKIAESVTDKDGILSFKGVITGVDYTVQELAAPNGFYVSEQPITISFKTDEKGNVVIDKVSDGNGTIVLSATGEITWLEPQIKVSFNKQDMNGKNLAGAKLKVVDSNGNDVISWTSTTEAYVVEGTFTAGETYKLVEVEAPEGYEIAEPVEFTIAEKAGANGADVISVIMKDKEKTTTTVTPPEKTTPPSVKTGDSAPVKPVTAMMFISLAGIVFLLILARRRKELFK